MKGLREAFHRLSWPFIRGGGRVDPRESDGVRLVGPRECRPSESTSSPVDKECGALDEEMTDQAIEPTAISIELRSAPILLACVCQSCGRETIVGFVRGRDLEWPRGWDIWGDDVRCGECFEAARETREVR